MTISTDPGVELVDLADDQAPELDDSTPFDITQKALGVAGLPPADMSRVTGFADDYEWATWLADVLRAANCSVIEYPGWKTRGRPRSVGPFTPRGVIWHHDASAKGPSPSLPAFIAEQGRPDDGIPAPLSQCWVALDGTWWVLAAGRANHAGIGAGFRSIPEDMGTTLTIGVETDNTAGEATPKAMYDSLVRGTAAIFRHLDTNPTGWLAGHKEYAVGRKIDPDDINMNQAREDVIWAMDPPKPPPPPRWEPLPYPGPEHFTVGHKCQEGWVEKVKDWLNDADPRTGTQLAGRGFTKPTARRIAEFQEAHPKRCKGDEPGDVGRNTWVALQRVARSA